MPQFGASLTDDASVIINDRNMFIMQAIVESGARCLTPKTFCATLCK